MSNHHVESISYVSEQKLIKKYAKVASFVLRTNLVSFSFNVEVVHKFIDHDD